MKCIELFSSYQGEGPDSGRAMVIYRFKDCDRIIEKYPCPYCDTIVKMRITEPAEYPFEQIKNVVEKCGGIMITGGEPTYKNNFTDTFILVTTLNYDVCNIESNGHDLISLIMKIKNSCDDSKVKYIYSPKFFNESELNEEIQRTTQLMKYDNVYIKVVDDQSKWLEDYLSEFEGMFRKKQLWIMPQGKTKEELIENSAHTLDLVEKYKGNFSSRDHVIYNYI